MHRVHKTSPEGCLCVISFGTIESSDKAIRKVFRHLEGERTHYSCRMRKCPLITTQLLYVSDTYILYLTLADVDGIVANSSQLVRSGLWVAGISVKQVRMYCCCFCCHVDIVLLSSLLAVGVVFFLLLLCLSSFQHCYHYNYCLFIIILLLLLLILLLLLFQLLLVQMLRLILSFSFISYFCWKLQ